MYLVSLPKLKKNIANMCCLLEGDASSKRLNSLAVQLSFLGGGGGYCSRVFLFRPEVSIVLCGGKQERSLVGRDAESRTSAHKVGTPRAWGRVLRPGPPRWPPCGPALPRSSRPCSVTSNSL